MDKKNYFYKLAENSREFYDAEGNVIISDPSSNVFDQIYRASKGYDNEFILVCADSLAVIQNKEEISPIRSFAMLMDAQGKTFQFDDEDQRYEVDLGNLESPARRICQAASALSVVD